MANDITSNTPITKMWDKIRKIKGKAPKRIAFLETDGQVYSTLEDIVEVHTRTLADTAATESYAGEF